MSKWYVGCLNVSEGQGRTGEVRIGQVRIGRVRIGQVRIGQVRTGQVRTDQVGTGWSLTLALAQLVSIYFWERVYSHMITSQVMILRYPIPLSDIPSKDTIIRYLVSDFKCKISKNR